MAATPTTGPWDDCFTALIGPVELHWDGVLDLYVESDCEHVVVFDEPVGALCVVRLPAFFGYGAEKAGLTRVNAADVAYALVSGM